MKGLLLKDWYMTIKYCKAYLVISVIFLVISFFDNGNSLQTVNLLFTVYPCILCGVVPVNLLAYDEKSRWIQYSNALPYTRAQIVSGKYLIGLFLQLVMLLITGIVLAIRMAIFGGFDFNGFLVIMAIVFAVSLVSSSFSLPFVFKFGVEKGRVAYYIAIGATGGISVFTSSFLSNTESAGVLSPIALLVAFFVGVTVYALSWYLSIIFYRKREF